MKNYDKEKEFIREMQGGVLLNDYTLTDMLWFMKNYHESLIKDKDNEKTSNIKKSK